LRISFQFKQADKQALSPVALVQEAQQVQILKSQPSTQLT